MNSIRNEVDAQVASRADRGLVCVVPRLDRQARDVWTVSQASIKMA